MGATKPDWRTPDTAALAADWKDMQVPGNWEARGLPDFDGVVWFTRTFDAPQGAPAGTLSVGRVSNTAEVWVNGISLSQVVAPPPPARRWTRAGAAAAGRRLQRLAAAAGNLPPAYELPAGVLKPGANTMTSGSRTIATTAASSGPPRRCSCRQARPRAALAGAWEYRVERQTNAGALYMKPGELAAHVAYAAAPAPHDGTLPEQVVSAAPDVVIRLTVTPGEMKFDKTELSVAPGQLVEIVFTNPDAMQHNFVLGAPDSLQAIGTAADDLARSPNGMAQQYVPQIPRCCS